jgi:hypothetical protein
MLSTSPDTTTAEHSTYRLHAVDDARSAAPPWPFGHDPCYGGGGVTTMEKTIVRDLARGRRRLPAHGGGASLIVAVALLKLGQSRMTAGSYAEAADLLADGLEVGQRAVGTEHPCLIQPLLMLADCLQRMARTDAADALYRRAARLAGGRTVEPVTVELARGQSGSAVGER